MSRLRECFGGSVKADMAAGDIQASGPNGVGAARFWSVTCDDSGRMFQLPDATTLRAGRNITVFNYPTSSRDFDIVDFEGGVVLTLAAGQVCALYLVDNTTANGAWVAVEKSAEVGSVWGTSGGGPVLPGRFVYDFTVSGAPRWPAVWNMLTRWDRVTAVTINVRVLAGAVLEQHALGTANTTASLDLTAPPWGWPAGSVCNLIVEPQGTIAGRGGRGGRGYDGSGTSGLDGEAGGIAIYTDVEMVITNNGTIQGGGGGGGGGYNSSAANAPRGGGGGGGAGAAIGVGGLGGGVASSGRVGLPGTDGFLSLPGTGGAGSGVPFFLPNGPRGGNGGAPGAAGTSGATSPGMGFSVPGAGGAAISRKSSVTVTKLVTGTILGSEVTH